MAVPDKLKNSVIDMSQGHWRIQAILININDNKTLLINLYLPVDKFINTLRVGLTEDKIIEDIDCDKLIIAGDLNYDFSRDTKHSMNVRNLMYDRDHDSLG